MVLIDTHAHIDHQSFIEEGMENIIGRARSAGVRYVIAPSSDLKSAETLREIAEKFTGVFFAAGLHAHEAKHFYEKDFLALKHMLEHIKAVAVGEVGLDYHYEVSPRSIQKHVLSRFLDLADSLNVPLILHCREAEEDLYWMLSKYNGRLRGVIHCYTGNAAWAKKFLELGFYLGFTGIITFEKSGEIRELAAQTPVDRILIETDSPYLAPHPHRGHRNEPAYVRFVAEKIARIHGKKTEEIAPIFLENAKKCFKLDIS